MPPGRRTSWSEPAQFDGTLGAAVRSLRSKQEDATMGDDSSKTDYRDRSNVAGDEDLEITQFAEEAGISLDQARTLIKRHGNDRKVLHEIAASLKLAAG
jgi:hypothetical protein